MPLRIVRLEERLLFDAAAAAVVADAAKGADGGDQSHEVVDQGNQSDQQSDASQQADPQNDPYSDGPGADPVQAVQEGQVNVLLVSNAVNNYQALADLAADDIRVVIYDSQDTLSDIYTRLETALNGERADTIGFASHGQSGMLWLNDSIYVTAYSLNASADLQSFWRDVGSLLNEGGRVDLLGCNVADLDEGLIDGLEFYLDSSGNDVDLAASTDMTGNGPNDNWLLEVGNVDASAYFKSQYGSWEGSLATYNVTNLNDSGAGSFRQAIIDSNNNTGVRDNINFTGLSGIAHSSRQIILSSSVTITEGLNFDTSGLSGSTPAGEPRVELKASFGSGSVLVITDTGAAGSIGISGVGITDSPFAAVQINSGDVDISNVHLGRRVAGFDSGNFVGIHIVDGTLDFFNSSVRSSASNAIRINGGDVNLTQVEILNSGTSFTANNDGGDGILIKNSGGTVGNVFMDRVRISGGSTSFGDDGIQIYNGTVTITDTVNDVLNDPTPATESTLSFNRDGIDIAGGSVTVSNIFISTNADYGIRVSESGTLVDGVKINSNFAGGIIIDDSGSTGGFNGGTLGGGSNYNIENSIIRFNQNTRGNGDGIVVTSGAYNPTLVGNSIYGNDGYGIHFDGGVSGDGGLIMDNNIGIEEDGVTANGNDLDGVYINSYGNQIKIGTDRNGSNDRGNVIGDNGGDGIRTSTSVGNASTYRNELYIRHNHIGTDASGTLDLGNTGSGVSISGAASRMNITNNEIANNSGYGVLTDSTLDLFVNVAPTISNNSLWQNSDDAIRVANTDDGVTFNNENGFTISGNYIDANGDNNGIRVAGGNNHTISGNIIWNSSANKNGAGIQLVSSVGTSLTDGTKITGNYIGMDPDDPTNNGNGFRWGIQLNDFPSPSGDGTSYVTIDGNVVGFSNYTTDVSTSVGIHVMREANNNLLIGNYVGVAPEDAGDFLADGADIGNFGEGVEFSDSSDLNDNNLIGDGTLANANWIGNNGRHGIRLETGEGHEVDYNFIGVNPVDYSDAGNTFSGIFITLGGGGSANDVDVTNNVIGFNEYGVRVQGSNNYVYGNFIGTDTTGTLDLGNDDDGVFVDLTPLNVRVGEDVSGNPDGNLIRFNGDNGVEIAGGTSLEVSHNEIWSNDDSGIVIIGSGVSVNLDNNKIGVDLSNLSDSSKGNTNQGIRIYTSGANNTTWTMTDSNIIGHNGQEGIKVSGGASSTIRGSIGLYGSTDIGNGTSGTYSGVLLEASTGGFTVDADIGYNTGSGVSMTTANGHTVENSNILYNGLHGISFSQINHTFQNNAIYGNSGSGISGGSSPGTSYSNGVKILNNWIGVNESNLADADAGNGAAGINFSGGGVGVSYATVDGNVIGYNTDGVSIRFESANNLFTNNYIGITPDGDVVGNENGVVSVVWSTATVNNYIGGTTLADANWISGNNIGVLLESDLTTPNVVLRNNYIGLGKDSGGNLVDRGNVGAGVLIQNDLRDHVISGNVIGFNDNGILITSTNGAPDGIAIIGNQIGAFIDQEGEFGSVGTLYLVGNDNAGISVTGGSDIRIGLDLAGSANGNFIGDNTIGVSVTGGSNVQIAANSIGIASDNSDIGNSGQGVYLAATNPVVVGGTLTSLTNYIGNNGTGIELGVGAHSVFGNWIGLDSTGADAGNSWGIMVTGGGNHLIGGTAHTFGGSANGDINVIGYNNVGIEVSSGSPTIQGNFIGVSSDGTTTVANNTGVLLSGASVSATVGGDGGTDHLVANIISGNIVGIEIYDGDHNVQGNLIGTNSAGTAARGNGTGILVTTAGTSSVIGGTGWSEGMGLNGTSNLISGNTTGIDIDSGAAVIKGNFVGTNLAGTGAVANTTGIYLSSSVANTLGGSGSLDRNLISGNTYGLELADGSHNVYGNWFGGNYLNDNGVENVLPNIYVTGGTNHQIGGTTNFADGVGAGDYGNVISRTTLFDGVRVWNTFSGELTIEGNSIGLLGDSTASGMQWGIRITSGEVTVTGNVISDNDTGVVIVGGSNHDINNNDFGYTINGVGGILENSSAVRFTNATVSDTTITSNNIAAGGSGDGIYVNSGGTGIEITQNSIFNAIRGIEVSSNVGMLLIDDNTIEFSDAAGADYNGILIGGSDEHFISNNRIWGYSGTNNAGIILATGSSAPGEGVQVLNNWLGVDSNNEGDSSKGNYRGLVIDNVTYAEIRGNTIGYSTQEGIVLSGTAANTQITGNYVGVSALGSDIGNLKGLAITESTTVDNLIGGTELSEANWFGFNTQYGVDVTQGSNNTVRNNFIGLNPVDLTDAGNGYSGVRVTGFGQAVIDGNVFGFNGNSGTSQFERTQIYLNASNIDVINNSIGLYVVQSGDPVGWGVAGTEHDIGNNGDGVVIFGDLNVEFGQSGLGNIVANSGANGIFVDPNGANLQIIDNSIYSNTLHGIYVAGGEFDGDVDIDGNFIGVDRDDYSDRGNTGNGIYGSFGTFEGVLTASNNTIGFNQNGISLVGDKLLGLTLDSNFIGTDSTGTEVLSNDANGIFVDVTGGGGVTMTDNLVENNLGDAGVYLNDGDGHQLTGGSASNNSGNGVWVASGSAGNTINLSAVSNGVNGIRVDSDGNQIGAQMSASMPNELSSNTEHGLLLNGDSNTVEGMIIASNAMDGVRIAGESNVVGGTNPGVQNGSYANYIYDNADNGVYLSGDSNEVYGNVIGLDYATDTASGNTNGIYIDNSFGHTIGGTSSDLGNFISGNTSHGININLGDATIQNNTIGLRYLSNDEAGNQGDGVYVGNLVNSASTIQDNLISGNDGNGITINGGSHTVLSNRVGLDKTSNSTFANTNGIVLNTTQQSTIGGLNPGDGNVLSGNTIAGLDIAAGTGHEVFGNYIGTNAAGTADAGTQQYGIFISGGQSHVIGGDSSAHRNVISGNDAAGILIDTRSHIIQGNYIGTSADGESSIANAIGIDVLTLFANTIGGDIDAGEGNLISGNVTGIRLAGSSTVSHNIFGNLIGTDDDGEEAVANQIGILVSDGNHNIGDGTDAHRNIISGNSVAGLQVNNGSQSVRGNYIGLSLDGSAAVSGAGTGVVINTDTANTVGGTGATDRNVISGYAVGVEFASGDGHSLFNNYIGTDSTGATDQGNAIGVLVSDGNNHQIGGSGTNERNVISGNAVNIQVDDGTANIHNNFIGLNAAGTGSVDTSSTGVWFNTATANTVGGAGTDQGNYISGNDKGVLLDQGTHSVLNNYIGTDLNGTAPVANTDGVFVNGGTNHTIASNTISGNVDGVEVASGTALIQQNTIGLNTVQDSALLNIFGVHLNSSDGSVDVFNNTISGNNIGVAVSEGSHTIRGNYIGTTASNATGVGNITGIRNNSTGVVTVGGLNTSDRNIISGNNGSGILANEGTVEVYNNYFGLTADGSDELRNAGSGIALLGGENHQIGSTAVGSRNYISGNNDNGIFIGSVDGVKVENNVIGLDVDGDVAANTQSGVALWDGSGTIGGDTDQHRNIITGNGSKGVFINGGSWVVQRNYIGTNLAGTAGVGDQNSGVEVDSYGFGANVNSLVKDNLISGNEFNGVRIAAGDGLTLSGNIIGLSYDQSAKVTNNTANNGFVGGIELVSSNATNVTIGGLNSTDRNVISGNTNAGIVINGVGSNLSILNNLIGTNDSFDTSVGNEDGILIRNGSNFTIGGSSYDTANVISGNEGDGVHALGGSDFILQYNLIGLNKDGDALLGNISNGVNLENTSGVELLNNTLSGNANGITLTGTTTDILVQGNNIGTNLLGIGSLGNIGNGINVESGASDIVIGGDADSERNIIANNNFYGIQLESSTVGVNTGYSTVIQGNYIGLDSSGLGLAGNSFDGIALTGDAANVLIGGENTGEGNVISGNGRAGIFDDGASNVEVYGNIIGLDADGVDSRGNQNDAFAGIFLNNASASNWVIGGATAGHRNIISGNDGSGIVVRGSSHTVQGNYIGTDITGLSALGNTANGVEVLSATDFVLGGAGAGEGNLISGNDANGVVLSNTDGAILYGNRIGVAATGTSDLGNSGSGLLVSGDSDNNVIGGTAAGAGNIFAWNGEAGVHVDGANADGNTIRGNSFYNNVGQAISLTNGGNDSQDSPFIFDAILDLNLDELIVNGIMDGPTGTDFLIQVYTDANDGIGGIEAKDYIASFIVTTNSPTNFTQNIAGPLPSDSHFVSFTATNLSNGNTSQFFSVVEGQQYVPPQPPPPPPEPGPFVAHQSPSPYPRPVDISASLGFGRNINVLTDMGERGQLNYRGYNQLTSNGTNIGYDNLVQMGNHMMSFTMLDDEPFLLNRNSQVGFGSAASALNYLYQPAQSRAQHTDGLLEKLSGQASEAEVDVAETLSGAERALNRFMSWFKS